MCVTDDNKEPNPIDGKASFTARASEIDELVAHKRAYCTAAVECDRYYERISELGLQFGPTFQGIRSALAGHNHCIGKIQIPNSAATMPKSSESGLIIHPATLDACLQSATLALKGITLEFTTLYVPTYVKSMSISHGIPKSHGHELNAYAKASESKSEKKVEATYLVTDANTPGNQPVIEADGFISSSLPKSNDGSATSSKRGLCFSAQHSTYLDLLSKAQYAIAFPSQEFGDKGTEQARLVEQASFYFARTALADLSASDVEALRGHLRKLYDFLAVRVAQGLEDSLPMQNGDWLEIEDADKAKFLEVVKSSSALGKLIYQMGKNLPAIFRGEIEPLSIMTKDRLLEDSYQSNLLLTQGYNEFTPWIKLLGTQKPQMRILEIGAGTGSATVHVLEALSNANGVSKFSSLEYTDISPVFFERAKERFDRWGDLISYRQLDISHDPVAQGFAPHSYDLIIASEVLHATPHIETTLQNVRTLLKSAGKLLMIETVLLTLYNSISYGTLPGNLT